ncbi:MAG TPA: STAS domain-containing protein [Bryobacteraceae bacterium]|nr:STAS domain-containing protein [Bryobacteraceae bacterium]
MIRVSNEDDGARIMVMVDGELSAESVEAVETCCNQHLSAGKPLYLYLRDVAMIDQSGRALLKRLAEKGVAVLASGVYTSYVVRALGLPEPAVPGSQSTPSAR